MIHEIEEFLPLVSKPARYVGGEINSVQKNWSETAIHVLLAFPELYEIGMSHLGLKILYHIINTEPQFLAERAYAPWPDMEDKMRERGLPLYSLESFKPARDFDIIGFSLQYEMTYTNVLNMLDLAGLETLSAKRGEDDPMVIAGGPCALNPEPMADFIDAFVIGEAEDVILEMLRIFEKSIAGGKADLLAAWSQIEGVYVPSLYDSEHRNGRFNQLVPQPGAPASIRRLWIADLESAPFPTAPPVPFVEAIHDRYVVEIMRGCSRGCRFCHAGMTYRPVRERSVDSICDLVKQGLDNTGYDAVTLASLSSTDYSEIEALVNRLTDQMAERRGSISLPSLRLDSFSIGVANKIQEVRKSGFTFAPEAATERLRRVINKNYTEHEMFRSFEDALKAGWDVFKLYFMLGLPSEKEEDVVAIGALIEDIRKIGRKVRGKKFRLNVSLSAFVPKPHTPFQWTDMVDEVSLRGKYGAVTSRVKWRDVKINWREASLCMLEALLARGDRRMGAIIRDAWKAGARFDGWTSELKLEMWTEAMAKNKIDFGEVTAFAYGTDDSLPWDHIDTGVKKSFLIEELERSRESKFTNDCREECLDCGVCGYVDLSH